MQSAAELESVGLFSTRQQRDRAAGGKPSVSVCHDRGRWRVLHRGEHLFRSGDEVPHVYRVAGGVLKSYYVHENGDEQIMGFHLTGDLVGFEALSDHRAAFSVVALDTASVRQEPGVEALGASVRGSLDRMVQASMRREILRLARMLHMERCGTDARLARFLLDYAEAQASRGYDRYEFHLPMGRKDLARYIGLVPETVSRIFGRLRDRGILAVENNHIRILDYAALAGLAGGIQE